MFKQQAIFVRTGNYPSILSNEPIGYYDLKKSPEYGMDHKKSRCDII